MYKLLLTFKYLCRRLIPVFALLSVTLCTAMVIIVISVMGGFLDHLRESGRSLLGDVTIQFAAGGFPHYGELIVELEKLPEVAGATPVVETLGLLSIPTNREDSVKWVQVMGIDGRGLDKVTGLRGTLYWTRDRLREEKDVEAVYGPLDPVEFALDMKTPPWRRVADYTPVVMGLEVSPYNQRTNEGTYTFEPPIIGVPMKLFVASVTRKGALGETAGNTIRVVPINEFHSGVYDTDSRQVFIPFDVAQEKMNMHEGPRVDEESLKEVGIDPARTTSIYIRAAEGVTPDELRERVEEVYHRVAARHDDMPAAYRGAIATWEERMSSFLRVVENERGLMAVLFGIISIVAVLIVGVIFYMIVLEKTRDIGTLRAIGASRTGVASIFITFALVIGTLGAGLGLFIAWLIVTYINEIHAWLGDSFGIVIWDRSVYFFDRIPSRIDPMEAVVVVVVAIVASQVGAIIPAIKAARVDPVESLRYE